MANINAFEQPQHSLTLTPTTDFSAKRYTFGCVNSTGDLVTPAAGARACGVVQTPGIAKEPCNVMTAGVSFIVIGATLTAGQEVEGDVNGKAIPLNTGKSNGVCIVGGAAGAIGSILIK